MDAELADMFPATVGHTPYSSQDSYGEAAYGSNTNYPAKIDGRQRVIRDVQGRLVNASYTVIFGQYVDVGVKDKITLPSGYTPQTPPILQVAKHTDMDGNHHTTVYMA